MLLCVVGILYGFDITPMYNSTLGTNLYITSEIGDMVTKLNSNWTTWATCDTKRANHEDFTLLVQASVGMLLDNGRFTDFIKKKLGKFKHDVQLTVYNPFNSHINLNLYKIPYN